MNRLPTIAGVLLIALGVTPLRAPRPDPVALRLRRHFATVERELLSRDISSLSASQRAERQELVRLLRRYSTEGRFPHNDFLPGNVPYFRDARGNLCAMAFLIAASGRGDIVDHVARTRNNAYVPELADEPGLAAWLDQHGLTLAEATRIQPTYGNQPTHNPEEDEFVASVGAGILSGLSIYWNARSMDRVAGHPARALTGVVASAANIGLGLAWVGDGAGKGRVAVPNLVIGTAAFALGVRALFAREPAAKRAPQRLRLQPVVAPGVRPRFGITGTFRF